MNKGNSYVDYDSDYSDDDVEIIKKPVFERIIETIEDINKKIELL